MHESTKHFARLSLISMIMLVGLMKFSAQNIVPNPGFEVYSECRRYLNSFEVLSTPPWLSPLHATSPSLLSTADVFNECASTYPTGVPVNIKGFQNPHSGKGYAGIISWNSDNRKEYLAVPLNIPLQAGAVYYVGFYLSLANGHCATNKMGIYFSEEAVPPEGQYMYDYDPQIESNLGWLSDTMGWMLIEGCYIAQGGEEYMTIGNFRTNSESDLFSPCSGFNTAYYYVDDVFVMPMTNLDLGKDFSICDGDLVTLYAGGGNTSYEWQDLSTADTFIVHAPGMYYVEASNICGVVADTIMVFSETDPPHITLPGMYTLCQGDEILLDPQVTSANYAWSNGSNSPTITVDTPGNYSLTVTNGCGSDTAQVVISDAGSEPTVSLGTGISICPGEMLEIHPVSTNVNEWLWYDGSTSSTIFLSSPGSIHVTVSNNCGTASDTVDVFLSNEPPILNLGEDITSCEGDAVLIHAGVTGVTYLWQDGSTVPFQIATKTDTFILQISNACGSTVDTILSQFNSAPPFPFLGNDTTLCTGDVHTLFWTGPDDVIIQWENGSDIPYNFIEKSGKYFITVSNLCGVNSDTIDIVFVAPPEAFSLGNDTLLCTGEILELAVPSSDNIVSWQDGSHLPTFSASATQMYSAAVMNQCGMQYDEIYVEIDERRPIVNSDFTLALCPEDTIQLDVTQSFEVGYEWSTGSLSSIIEATIIGEYQVSISTPCTTEEFEFEVVPGSACNEMPSLFIPSVFSPNGDGINDVFAMYINEDYPAIIGFSIFDRLGNLVFQINEGEQMIEWDGKFNGKTLNPGVFTYLAKVKYLDGLEKFVYGDITLIR